MGDFDYVKAVLDRIGDMRWMQIAIRPAKPFAFGTWTASLSSGLPGNPVSSMVSFELLARPGAAGRCRTTPTRCQRRWSAVADEDLRRQPDGKIHFMRVAAGAGDDGRYHVRSSWRPGLAPCCGPWPRRTPWP